LHRRCWGDRIVSTLRCDVCQAQFDLSFTLSELQLQLHAQGRQWQQQQSLLANWQAPFPPSGEQELAAAGLAEQGRTADSWRALMQTDDACAAQDEQALFQTLAEALEHSAPILDVELDARCAECSHAQQAHFDVQGFVLQRLLNERALLLHEIHVIAAGYGWSFADILALPRSTRRSFAQMLSQSPRRRTAEQDAARFWS